MRILGCLGTLLLFFFLLGFMILGNFLLSVRRLFKGGSQYQAHEGEQPKPQSQKPAEPEDYRFQPGDGEYIDFEEVKDK